MEALGARWAGQGGSRDKVALQGPPWTPVLPASLTEELGSPVTCAQMDFSRVNSSTGSSAQSCLGSPRDWCYLEGASVPFH